MVIFYHFNESQGNPFSFYCIVGTSARGTGTLHAAGRALVTDRRFRPSSAAGRLACSFPVRSGGGTSPAGTVSSRPRSPSGASWPGSGRAHRAPREGPRCLRESHQRDLPMLVAWRDAPDGGGQRYGEQVRVTPVPGEPPEGRAMGGVEETEQLPQSEPAGPVQQILETAIIQMRMPFRGRCHGKPGGAPAHARVKHRSGRHGCR